MSIQGSEVVQIVVGLLSDPGSSSKNHKALVDRAIEIYKEVEFRVTEENERLNASKQAAQPAATTKQVTHTAPPVKPVVQPTKPAAAVTSEK